VINQRSLKHLLISRSNLSCI